MDCTHIISVMLEMLLVKCILLAQYRQKAIMPRYLSLQLEFMVRLTNTVLLEHHK